MRDVFINDSRDPDGTSTYVAREGVIVRTADRPVMVLLDGNVQQIDSDDSLSFLTFERYEFDLSEFVDAAQVLFFKDSDGLATTLVAKDRVLAHNPIGALNLADSYYSRIWGPGRPDKMPNKPKRKAGS